MANPRTELPSTLSELLQRAVLTPRTGCLVWDGRMNLGGYGQIGISRRHAAELGIGQTILVHRLAWQLAKGPIPDGMQIDHLCRNRACINVAHMEIVTPSENVRRGDGPVLSGLRMQAIRAQQREDYKTHCVHGHELSADNIYADRRGFRSCRECQRIRARTWKHRNKARRGPNGYAPL